MKILLIGDASHYHASLAEALRRKGHIVTLASAGSGWMNTPRDIDLSRLFRGKAGGALLYARLSALLLTRLRGYDIVQIAGPLFLSLLPHRNLNVFRRLKRNNGKIVVSALATDTPYIDYCMSSHSKLAYNEWRVGTTPTSYAITPEGKEVNAVWHTDALASMCDKIYTEADGVLSALYEYHLSVSEAFPATSLAYAGIPIDTALYASKKNREFHKEVNIFLGRHADRIHEKGTDILEKAAREAIAASCCPARLTIVENLPYARYIEGIAQADLVLDQIYSYTPATNALIAMSMGIPVVSGGEEEFYGFIGEKELRPVVNINPADYSDMVSRIKFLIENPAERLRLGEESAIFAKKHNSLDAVAERVLAFYHKIQS